MFFSQDVVTDMNMANLNSTAYANGGGITIPNGVVVMPNNPRGINPMHLAPPSLNQIGLPAAMLGTNMNNRQMQMSIGQTLSPPIT